MKPRRRQKTEPDSSFIAWEIGGAPDVVPEPAPSDRPWMDATNRRVAYRCLPLVIANQAGWILRSPVSFSARWNGGPLPKDVRLWFGPGRRYPHITSHFGDGILTFSFGLLFQTPPGINLWVKGPANWLKDGIQPLEGVVETDWNDATFTMNWRFTRPGQRVRFERGEPFCMLVPVPRGLAESLTPVQRPLAENPEKLQRFQQWGVARAAFNEGLREGDEETIQRGWQRDYMLGLDPNGAHFPGHQTKLNLRSFRS